MQMRRHLSSHRWRAMIRGRVEYRQSWASQLSPNLPSHVTDGEAHVILLQARSPSAEVAWRAASNSVDDRVPLPQHGRRRQVRRNGACFFGWRTRRTRYSRRIFLLYRRLRTGTALRRSVDRLAAQLRAAGLWDGRVPLYSPVRSVHVASFSSKTERRQDRSSRQSHVPLPT